MFDQRIKVRDSRSDDRYYVVYETIDEDNGDVQCFDIYEDDGEGNGTMVCRGHDMNRIRSMVLSLGEFIEWDRPA